MLLLEEWTERRNSNLVVSHNEHFFILLPVQWQTIGSVGDKHEETGEFYPQQQSFKNNYFKMVGYGTKRIIHKVFLSMHMVQNFKNFGLTTFKGLLLSQVSHEISPYKNYNGYTRLAHPLGEHWTFEFSMAQLYIEQ